jgi:hypothetical protein
MSVPFARRAAAAGLLLGASLAAAPASAQSVVTRTITTQPVETTVTQTPNGTIVTRRPVDAQGAAPVVAAPSVAAVPVARAPATIDQVVTREVVERRDAGEARRLVTRPVSAHRATHRAAHRGKAGTVKRTTTQTTRTTRTAPRLALEPAERHIVYRTIVERAVVPSAPVVAQPQYTAPIIAQPPVVAADEEPVYTVGSVLPQNVPLYAMPQNVALRVPATQPFSYAWLGGRAYVVDPASGVVMADVTE